MPLLLLAILGCNPSPSVLDHPSAVEPVRPTERAITATPLHRRPELLRAVLFSENNRPEGTVAPAQFSPVAPFRKVERYKDVTVYGTPLPVRSNLLPDRQRGTHSFGSAAPPDFVVSGPSGQLQFARGGRKDQSYGYTREELLIGVASGGAPRPEEVQISFPRATQEESALNHSSSGLSDHDFLIRTFTIDKVSHSGLYLPAPSRTEWEVTVPERGVLTFRGTVLTPAIRDLVTSNGADVVVEVATGDQAVEVGRARLAVDQWSPERIDLSAFAGQTVQLVLRTDPRGDPTYDYVFLEGPTIYTPSDDPRRVVLVFVDTLRADHLGTYGYTRLATPRLDRWARFGAVFEQARTVAPWTLPSARAVLSGRQPEHWRSGRTLAEQLSDAGYHTDAIVANAFLSQPFQMERGWTRFTYEHLLPAPDVARHAREVLAAHPDRDVALLVHFMDPHLPYDEPWLYRHIFAGTRPGELESLTRRWLVKVHPETPGFEAIRDYVIDRYDQNLRYVDDHLAPLLEEAGLGATVVLFSDHGEEFWDHGGFEHGHTFYDELLRVPLIVRGPKVPAGRVSAPVSLLDVPETVLELEGLPGMEEAAGRSLVPLLWGEEGAASWWESRPQGFGRPLYGEDGWAVLSNGSKWIGRGERQHVFDLTVDPGETTDLSRSRPLEPFAHALSDALGTEVKLAWRVSLKGRQPKDQDNVLEIAHPEGVQTAFFEYDPRGEYGQLDLAVLGDRVVVRQPKGAPLPDALFVVPAGDPLSAAGLEVRIRGEGVELEGTATPRPLRMGQRSPTILVVAGSGWEAVVNLAWVPLPQGEAVEGFAPEMEAQLRELGYLD